MMASPGAEARRALDHLAAQADDAVVAVQVHTHQRDRLRWPRRAAPGRCPHTSGDTAVIVGMALQQRHQGLPVGHRAQALRARLRVGDHRRACGCGQAGVTTSSGTRSVIWACAPSVLVSVLLCRPLISAEMKATTATPAATPTMISRALHAAFAQEAQCDAPFEAEPVEHGDRAAHRPHALPMVEPDRPSAGPSAGLRDDGRPRSSTRTRLPALQRCASSTMSPSARPSQHLDRVERAQAQSDRRAPRHVRRGRPAPWPLAASALRRSAASGTHQRPLAPRRSPPRPTASCPRAGKPAAAASSASLTSIAPRCASTSRRDRQHARGETLPRQRHRPPRSRSGPTCNWSRKRSSTCASSCSRPGQRQAQQRRPAARSGRAPRHAKAPAHRHGALSSACPKRACAAAVVERASASWACA